MKPFYFDSFYRHGEKHVAKFRGDACKPVLFWVSITTVKTPWPKSKLGRKMFIWHTLSYSSSSLMEDRTGTQTWRQDLMQILWRGAAYCFAPHGFLISPFSYSTQDHQPRNGPTHHELSIPSITMKMPYSRMEAFS